MLSQRGPFVALIGIPGLEQAILRASRGKTMVLSVRVEIVAWTNNTFRDMIIK